MTAEGATSGAGSDSILIDFKTTMGDLRQTIGDTSTGDLIGYNLLNIDVRSYNSTGTFNIFLVNSIGKIILGGETGTLGSLVGTLPIATGVGPQSLTSLNDTAVNTGLFSSKTPDTNNVGLLIQHVGDTTNVVKSGDIDPIVADFFSFGFSGDGVQASERTANQIIRIEAEESGDNTGIFEGSLEYIMVNQLNISVESTYLGLSTIGSAPSFIVIEDLTDEDAPRVTIADLGADGVVAFISDQEEAPSHSGVVSFNADSYKQADTVEITLEDLDLNTDSSLIDIYTTVGHNTDENEKLTDPSTDPTGGADNDQVGIDVRKSLEELSFGSLGFLLGITFDDVKWQNTGDKCECRHTMTVSLLPDLLW